MFCSLWIFCIHLDSLNGIKILLILIIGFFGVLLSSALAVDALMATSWSHPWPAPDAHPTLAPSLPLDVLYSPRCWILLMVGVGKKKKTTLLGVGCRISPSPSSSDSAQAPIPSRNVCRPHGSLIPFQDPVRTEEIFSHHW